MKRNIWLSTALGIIGLAVVLLIFWGWRQGSLSLLQLGLSQC